MSRSRRCWAPWQAAAPSVLPFCAIFGNKAASLCDMAIVDRKQQLFENVARLRRVGRLVPDNEDLFAVRLELEQELGETISRRLAAKLLGVSHPLWNDGSRVATCRSCSRRQDVKRCRLRRCSISTKPSAPPKPVGPFATRLPLR